MAFWDKFTFRNKDKDTDVNKTRTHIPFYGDYGWGGYGVNSVPQHIPPGKSRVLDILSTLRRIGDVYDAIDFLSENHPDMSQAIQSYVRLANSGHTVEIYYPGSDERNTEAEARWREVAMRVGSDINIKGYDGIIDQELTCLIMYGCVGTEITVNRRMRDIKDIHLIKPQWLEWERGEKDKTWRAYQYQNSRQNKVEITGPNFFWASLDNKIGTPIGRIPMQASLMAIDRQLQHFEDSAAVLRQVGYPRDVVTIDVASYIARLPANVKNDSEKLDKALRNYCNTVSSDMGRIEPTQAIVVASDTKIDRLGNQGSNSIDERAHTESLDPQVMNGLATPSFLLNRTTGETETWGGVQLKVAVDYINNSLLRTIKRTAENHISFWLRLQGIPGTVKFIPNPVDYEAEKVKREDELLRMEYNRRGEEYGWKKREAAAKDGMGINKDDLPKDPPPTTTEYLSHRLSVPLADNTKENNNVQSVKEDNQNKKEEPNI